MREIRKILAVYLSFLLVSPFQVFAQSAPSGQTQGTYNTVPLNNEAPPIFYSEKPAILLQLDGPPVWSPISSTTLKFAVNTNWDLLQDSSGTLYLLNQEQWLKTSHLEGPWIEARELPAEFQKIPKNKDWERVRAQLKVKPSSAPVPVVFVSQRPAELIVAEGGPQWETIPGTELSWARNSDTDLFFHQGEKDYYYLSSGRWFRSNNLQNASWKFASNDLPKDFTNFPRSHPESAIRAFVPGTTEAQALVKEASTPQKARVKRNAKAADIDYAGEPQFQDIQGTDLQYAVNTSNQVIKSEGRYYLVKDGVWFVSSSPKGPWSVADYVPAEIYNIPSDSPMHNVTYVRVYDYDDNEVEFGYNSGYWGGFLLGTGLGLVLTYGSGWYWNPYVYWDSYYPVYYGYPYSYGYGGYYPYYYNHHHPYNDYYNNHYYNNYDRGSRYDRGGGRRPYYGPHGGAGSAVYNPQNGTYSRNPSSAGWSKTPRMAPSSWATQGQAAPTRQGQNQNLYRSWGKSATSSETKWNKNVGSPRGTKSFNPSKSYGNQPASMNRPSQENIYRRGPQNNPRTGTQNYGTQNPRSSNYQKSGFQNNRRGPENIYRGSPSHYQNIPNTSGGYRFENSGTRGINQSSPGRSYTPAAGRSYNPSAGKSYNYNPSAGRSYSPRGSSGMGGSGFHSGGSSFRGGSHGGGGFHGGGWRGGGGGFSGGGRGGGRR